MSQSNHEFIELTTTTAGEQEAHALARHLVEQRLAACVQVSGAIRSVYRWQGEVCEANEVRLTVKSLGSLKDQLIQAIESQHSYDTPEIVISNIAECSPKYGQWLRQQVD